MLKDANKLVEAQRLEQRTRFDLEMIKELGYCSGIENYSRYLSGRQPGQPPPTLFDYLPKDALLIVDESHVTVPQLGGMYKGDRSRKETLVEYGFRLPSRPRQSAVAVRRVGGVGAADDFRLCDSRTLRGRTGRKRRGAGRAPHGTGRPGRGRSTRVDPGGRSLRGDPAHRGPRRTGAGDNADQAHGGGSHRVPGRARRTGPLPALGHRHGRTHGNRTGSAARQVRRSGGHQPPARGARHAGGLAGGDPRRRQGRIPTCRTFADPDHRPGSPQPERPARSSTPTR